MIISKVIVTTSAGAVNCEFIPANLTLSFTPDIAAKIGDLIKNAAADLMPASLTPKRPAALARGLTPAETRTRKDTLTDALQKARDLTDFLEVKAYQVDEINRGINRILSRATVETSDQFNTDAGAELLTAWQFITKHQATSSIDLAKLPNFKHLAALVESMEGKQ